MTILFIALIKNYYVFATKGQIFETKSSVIIKYLKKTLIQYTLVIALFKYIFFSSATFFIKFKTMIQIGYSYKLL